MQWQLRTSFLQMEPFTLIQWRELTGRWYQAMKMIQMRAETSRDEWQVVASRASANLLHELEDVAAERPEAERFSFISALLSLGKLFEPLLGRHNQFPRRPELRKALEREKEARKLTQNKELLEQAMNLMTIDPTVESIDATKAKTLGTTIPKQLTWLSQLAPKGPARRGDTQQSLVYGRHSERGEFGRGELTVSEPFITVTCRWDRLKETARQTGGLGRRTQSVPAPVRRDEPM